MLRKVLHKAAVISASLILAAGIFSGCSDALDITAGGKADAAGARAVSSGSQPNHYVEVKATSTSGWDQTNKFQFKLSNLSINSGDAVSFQLMTPANATKLTVRGVSSGSKWIKDVSVSGNKWYSVSATATAKETEIGITVYCTAKSGLTVRVGDLKVASTWIAAKTLVNNVKEYYASPKSFSVSTNDSGSSNPPDNPVEKPINSKLKMVTAGPGKDCSTEMSVSWHSPTKANYVEYVVGDNLTVTFNNAKKVDVTGEYRDSGRQWIDSSKNKITFYSCKAYLTGLTPNTSYVYRVGNADGVSKPKKFKTAGTSGSFSFTWLADVHTAGSSDTYRKHIKTVMDKTKNSDFVMFSGDLVDVGNLYHEWEYFTGNDFVTNYMVASVPGNHDYYRSDNGSSRYKRSYVSNKWWVDCAATPKTNASLDPSNYWFLYNGVLFINIDSIQNDQSEQNYTDVSKQIAWFKDVMTANKGKYNFVIVQQHFAYIIDSEVKYGRIDKWSPIFREYKVDLALGADSHEYSRSTPIYWDKDSKSVKAGNSNDTIYMTAFQLNGSADPSSKSVNSTLCKKHITGGRGGCKIDVTKDTLKLTLVSINKDGSVSTNADSVTISKKSR